MSNILRKQLNNLVTKEHLEHRLDIFYREFKNDIEKSFEHHIGVLMEDNRHQIQMIAEGVAMQIEMGQKRWEEQTALNTLYEWRFKKIES